MTTEIITTNIQTKGMAMIVALVTNAVTSQHTQRAYKRALASKPEDGKDTVLGFLPWYEATGKPGLNKATVQAHVAYLRAAGTTASSINQRLTAGLYDGTTHPLFKVAIVLHNGGNLAGAKRGAMNTVDPALWLIWIVALMIVFLFPGVFKVD